MRGATVFRQDRSADYADYADYRDFLDLFFGVFQGEPIKVRIWFHPDVAGYIKEKIWHESQEIEEQNDGSIIFEAEVAGTEEIKFWIMNWGSKALVIEPETLRDEIRAEAETMVEKYGKGIEEKELGTDGLLKKKDSILHSMKNYSVLFKEAIG